MIARDTILVAMVDAGNRIGFHRFSTAEVVVAAYGFDPERFCLRGYRQHPDSKRVTVEMARLRQLGFIRLISEGVWIVTEEGGERAYQLKQQMKKGAA